MNQKDFLLKKLTGKGFDSRIVEAFRKIERAEFIPQEEFDLAYEDIPLPIGEGQTISQPYTIAFMLQLLDLKDGQKILEVGSGSGYVLALLNAAVQNAEIYGAERILSLVKKSQEVLSEYDNIKIFHTSVGLGLSEHQPYDRILVSAAAENIPQNLLLQLKADGVMVCPVGDSIVRIIKRKGEVAATEEYPGFVFVPLVE